MKKLFIFLIVLPCALLAGLAYAVLFTTLPVQMAASLFSETIQITDPGGSYNTGFSAGSVKVVTSQGDFYLENVTAKHNSLWDQWKNKRFIVEEMSASKARIKYRRSRANNKSEPSNSQPTAGVEDSRGLDSLLVVTKFQIKDLKIEQLGTDKKYEVSEFLVHGLKFEKNLLTLDQIKLHSNLADFEMKKFSSRKLAGPNGKPFEYIFDSIEGEIKGGSNGVHPLLAKNIDFKLKASCQPEAKTLTDCQNLEAIFLGGKIIVSGSPNGLTGPSIMTHLEINDLSLSEYLSVKQPIEHLTLKVAELDAKKILGPEMRETLEKLPLELKFQIGQAAFVHVESAGPVLDLGTPIRTPASESQSTNPMDAIYKVIETKTYSESPLASSTNQSGAKLTFRVIPKSDRNKTGTQYFELTAPFAYQMKDILAQVYFGKAAGNLNPEENSKIEPFLAYFVENPVPPPPAKSTKRQPASKGKPRH